MKISYFGLRSILCDFVIVYFVELVIYYSEIVF